jgi:hypothetical protein
MKKPLSADERALRIELARTRAAIERQTLELNIQELGSALQPSRLLAGLFPRLASKARPTAWLQQGMSLTRRYPLLFATVSTVLSRVGKRHRWGRLGAGLLLSWQIARAMGLGESKPDTRASDTDPA